MFTPNEHEETFDVKPIGVRYICEFCGEGEMKVDNSSNFISTTNGMIKHKCNKCNGELLLPKMYPYIEWIPIKGKITVNGKEIKSNEATGISMDVE